MFSIYPAISEVRKS